MIKKLLLASVLFVALTTAGYAQYNVSFSVILDVSGYFGASSYCNAYNPGNSTFMTSTGGAAIQEISAVSGLPTGASYNMTGQLTGGLGFFGIGADTAGNAYGANAVRGSLVRWADTTVQAATLAMGVPFTRNMCIFGSGLSIQLGLAGAANTGDITIMGTTDDVAFYVIDSVTGISKSGHCFDAALTQAWGCPDNWNAINKKVKVGGVWVSDNVIDGGVWDKDVTALDVGPMFYDDVNDLLIGSSVRDDALYAYDGTDGKEYGSQAIGVDGNVLAGYNGGYADNFLAGSGTFYFAQRGSTTTSGNGYHVGIANYGVTSVNDWTLY